MTCSPNMQMRKSRAIQRPVTMVGPALLRGAFDNEVTLFDLVLAAVPATVVYLLELPPPAAVDEKSLIFLELLLLTAPPLVAVLERLLLGFPLAVVLAVNPPSASLFALVMLWFWMLHAALLTTGAPSVSSGSSESTVPLIPSNSRI